MPRTPITRPCRNRGKLVWKADVDAGQVWTDPSLDRIYRRIQIRNDLIRNIAATQRPASCGG